MNRLIERLDHEFNYLEASEIGCFHYLIQVFENQDREALDYYLSKRLPINPRNEYLRTPAFLLRNADVSFLEYSIEKGLDLNVLDINGQSILFELFNSASEEVLAFVLSKGLDPFDKDFDGKDLFAFKHFHSSFITEEFLAANSAYSRQDFSYEQALVEKNFPLVLSIVEQTIFKMGGLNKLANHLDITYGYNILKKLYNALILNKKYEEANAALKFYLYVTENTLSSGTQLYPFGLTAPLLLNDVHTAQKMASSNRDNCHGFEKYVSIAHSFSTVKEIDDIKSAFVVDFRRSGRMFLARNGVDSLYVEICTQLFMKTIPMPLDYIASAEERIAAVDLVSQLDYFFLLGLVFMHKKDKDKAEYYFIRVINLSIQLGCKYDDLMAQSYGMIDYLNQNN